MKDENGIEFTPGIISVPTLQSKLSLIRAECHKAIELGEKATPGPWICDEDDEGHFVETPERCITNTGTKDDAKFLAHSRTFYPAAARAMLGLMDALERVVAYEKDSPYGKGICPYGCDTPWLATKALQTLADQWNETK